MVVQERAGPTVLEQFRQYLLQQSPTAAVALLEQLQRETAARSRHADPLHHSTLRILDDGGGLGLVLNHIHEDDALCAALVCTTFRDAMFAQARHSVRGAGKSM